VDVAFSIQWRSSIDYRAAYNEMARRRGIRGVLMAALRMRVSSEATGFGTAFIDSYKQ
jgi:hypothetical protein